MVSFFSNSRSRCGFDGCLWKEARRERCESKYVVIGVKEGVYTEDDCDWREELEIRWCRTDEGGTYARTQHEPLALTIVVEWPCLVAAAWIPLRALLEQMECAERYTKLTIRFSCLQSCLHPPCWSRKYLATQFMR